MFRPWWFNRWWETLPHRFIKNPLQTCEITCAILIFLSFFNIDFQFLISIHFTSLIFFNFYFKSFWLVLWLWIVDFKFTYFLIITAKRCRSKNTRRFIFFVMNFWSNAFENSKWIGFFGETLFPFRSMYGLKNRWLGSLITIMAFCHKSFPFSFRFINLFVIFNRFPLQFLYFMREGILLPIKPFPSVYFLLFFLCFYKFFKLLRLCFETFGMVIYTSLFIE